MGGDTIEWRPLTQWPAGRPRTPEYQREDAKFKATGGVERDALGNARYVAGKRTPLSRTLQDLDRELDQIGARDVVVQLDITERQLRRDGGIRADARAASPAVVLTFKRKAVPYAFACDHFKRWEDNLRAIALGLEGLRRLERYHIAQAGDQYRGWQALPASTTALSTNAAADVLARRTGRAAAAITTDREVARAAYREAANAAHPDRTGGATEDFQLIQEAKRVLEAHFGGAL